RRLWVATEKGVMVGVLHDSENNPTPVFNKVENSPFGEVSCIFEDHQQRIYFTSPNSGIYKVTTKTSKGYTIGRFLANDITSCSVIRELEIGDSYYLLIGCNNGLYRFDFQTGELTKIRTYRVMSLLVNHEEK